MWANLPLLVFVVTVMLFIPNVFASQFAVSIEFNFTHCLKISCFLGNHIKNLSNITKFLINVLVKRNSHNGSITTHSLLSTTIYRKPTHTNRYLHYTSHHPKHQKLTVAKTLLNRVNTHITDNTQKNSELQNIRSTLRLNGFPTRTTFLTSRQPRSQNTRYNHFTSIPYIQGTSEKIRRVLNEAGVKVAIKPIHTIGRILPSPKDPLTLEEKSCLVYQVPCFDCDFVYIGQTKRDLKSRIAEHKLAIRNQEPEKSALCEHSIQFDHLIDWNNSRVLKTEAHYSKRLTSEAWFINSHPHVMNRSDGDSLPRVYRRLITS